MSNNERKSSASDNLFSQYYELSENLRNSSPTGTANH